ncbi:MAG: KEOPS complex subunit Pcc1 [Candidatus Bathyarchaeota archaeon]|nr:KEOPS complex subunit Pcc1 [Candidatus Bathyarchaeota archaeon]
MEARITLVYEDRKEAKAVSEAVSPDNIKTPENLSVETLSTDNSVVTSIEYEGDNLMTFLATIDDLLSCASVAEKTFSAIKKI